MEEKDLMADLLAMGRQARQAQRQLAIASAALKAQAIHAMAAEIAAQSQVILDANRHDVELARGKSLATALLDRLELDEARIEAMVTGLHQIAEVPDPVGNIISSWQRPNGLRIERVRTPLGVIGVIYESRPNVSADAAALCLKAGNAVILRGGSDSLHSSLAIHAALERGLEQTGLAPHLVQMVPSTDRQAVAAMLKGLEGNLDVIVPRGGKNLVALVQEQARVPVFAHLEGICHIYVDQSARLDMARAVVLNAKMRRTGICGALETLLIDRSVAASHLVPILTDLVEMGCEIRGCADVVAFFPQARPAREEDWETEYLDAILSVKLVDGVGDAIAHIQRYSSHHTESIIAEDTQAVNMFFAHIDSAIVLHNASTQFADGGEFGFGGEIGIATGKMHARGPIGVEQLTSFNYRIHGQGQVRP